jgi:NAD(P)-dependent dehydrogenase (short-subunit alcohol dehydrogenase family)
MPLSGKDALITWGDSGIDLAVARLFLAEGADVAIIGRNQKTLRGAAAELGDAVLPIQADVTDIVAIEHALLAVAEEFGKVDIVFANAGIGVVTPVCQTSLAAFDEVIPTNLMAVLTLTTVFFTMEAVATHLEAGASVILNGSVHAAMGVPGLPAYGAFKAGVHAMTRSLALKFAPHGIRVNSEAGFFCPNCRNRCGWSQPGCEAVHRIGQSCGFFRLLCIIIPDRLSRSPQVASLDIP